MARILVLGSGPAGLASALHLAANHQEVILVEKEERLGGSPGFTTAKRWVSAASVEPAWLRNVFTR